MDSPPVLCQSLPHPAMTTEQEKPFTLKAKIVVLAVSLGKPGPNQMCMRISIREEAELLCQEGSAGCLAWGSI